MPFQSAALSLALALACGALIGSERQFRQHTAGLRTNALVALGAATFVMFSTLFPNEASPTRMAAQVVSGIGFLGAGIIFRHGYTVHGLNTAATLWCSAAVGVMAGTGAYAYAVLATSYVVVVNIGLRPLVRWIKRKTRGSRSASLDYHVRMACRGGDETAMRALTLNALGLPGVQVSGIEQAPAANEGEVRLDLVVTITDPDEAVITRALGPIMAEPSVLSLTWEPVGEG